MKKIERIQLNGGDKADRGGKADSIPLESGVKAAPWNPIGYKAKFRGNEEQIDGEGMSCPAHVY